MTVRAHDRENDVFVVPQIHGSYRVKLFYEGTPVSGGPMGFEVSPEPTSKVVGPDFRNDGVLGSEYVVKVASINCTLNNYKVAVKGPSGSVVGSFNLDPNGNDVGITTKFTPSAGSVNPNGIANGIYDFKFTPKQVGDHVMIFFFNGAPLPGSPVTIQANPSHHQSATYGTTQVVNKSTAAPYTSPRPIGLSSSGGQPTTVSTHTTGPQVIGATGGGPQVINAGGPQVISAGGPQVIGAVGGGPTTIGAVSQPPTTVTTSTSTKSGHHGKKSGKSTSTRKK